MSIKDLIRTVVKDNALEEKIITHKTLTLGFLILCLMLFGYALIVYFNIERTLEIQNKIACINSFTNKLDALVLSIEEAKADLSDYMITYNKEYLISYDQNLLKIRNQGLEIKSVAARDPQLAKLIQPSNGKILQKIDAANGRLEIFSKAEEKPTEEDLLTGKNNAQEIKDIVQKIKNDAQGILEEQTKSFKNATTFMFLVLFLSSAISLGFLSILYYLLLNNLKIYIYNDIKKDEFINMASHELKTPVTSMKIYSELLQDRLNDKKDNESLKYAQKIEEQSNKLTTLITDLLDISKIQTGKLEYHYSAFNLDELARDIISTMQPAHKKHKIYIFGSMKHKIYGDRDKIGEVITNLISNAIKYSPKANTVNVKLSETSKGALIAIQDFGMGIPQEYQKKIFERFFRVHSKTFPGMGIGLYICDQIVKRHCGNIKVKSTPNKGSIFTVYLPYNGCEEKYEK